MFELDVDWWEIILRTVIVYGALVAGFRLTGKRQIGQMAPFDLVVILLIANAVQNAMVGPDTSLTGGLIAAGALLAANASVAYIQDHVPFLGKLVEGQPAILIADGKVVEPAVRRERIDLLELEQAIREHGIDSIDDVKLAVLEVDGTISIVPTSAETVRTKRRFRQEHHQA